MPTSHSIKFFGLFLQKNSLKSPTATSFAVILAVCLYKSGFEYTLTSLLKKAVLEFDTCLQKQWCGIDTDRIRKGDYAVRDIWKEKHKLKEL